MSRVISLDDLVSKYNNDKVHHYLIPELILENTSIIYSAREKAGKTTILLQLLKSIDNDEDFLDIKKGNYNIDAIVFFSNDSTPQSIAIKLKKMDYNSTFKIPIYFIFGKSMTIYDLADEISELKLMNANTLIVVDVLSGLRTKAEINLNDYQSVSTFLDEFEIAMQKVTKTYGIIYLHHLNKGNREMMGSQALGARVSAKLIMKLDNYDTSRGLITISANDYNSRTIFVKKDEKKHRWIIDKNGCLDADKEVEFQILRINESLSRKNEKRFRGTVNEICSYCRLSVPPRSLTRWLKAHKKQLRDNNIVFTIKKSNTTMIELYIEE